MALKYYQPSEDNPWSRQGNTPAEATKTSLVPKTFGINVASGEELPAYKTEPFKLKPVENVFPTWTTGKSNSWGKPWGGAVKKAVGASGEGTGTYLMPKSVNTEQAVKMGSVAATSLGQLALINKVKKAQQQRQMLMLNPVQTSVRPITDLPSEILNQRANDIAKIRSTYAGSDAATQMIGQQQAAAQRDAATDKFTAERATHMLTDQERFDQQNQENQKRAAEMQNTNIERKQALNDYKLESTVNALDQKKKLLSQVGKDVVDIADTSAAYKLNNEIATRSGSQAALDTKYKMLEAERMSVIDKNPLDPRADDLWKEMQKVSGEYQTSRKTPFSGYWTHYKNGGKLMPRI